LETEENEGVTDSFLTHYRDFEAAPLKAREGLSTDGGNVRTWPHRDASDGFFATAFRRYR
jgi:16S rRNA C967 or C1407 C5-methylase (RsmB/RsmF family)